MRDNDLTVSECRVRHALVAGDRIDFRDIEHLELEDVASGAQWGPERTERAEVLVELLTGECRPNEQQPRALRLAGVRIAGKLELEDLVVVRPLVLEACFSMRGCGSTGRVPRVWNSTAVGFQR